MAPLSVAIVARDEADRVGAALDSVAFADEIVVLDSGSTDDTVAICAARGARVMQTDWPGYVAQKNRALAACRHGWVLSLDADEVVSPALAEEIQALLRGEPPCAGYAVARRNHWLGAPMTHGTWGRDWKLRLIRRDRARWEGTEPHDAAVVDGPVGRLRGAIDHHPYRDLGEHLATIDRYTRLAARDMARQGRKAHWWDLLFRPTLHFVAAFLLRRGFLDGVRGLLVAGLGATYVLLKWGRLALGPDQDQP